jgi:hypothetical protein
MSVVVPITRLVPKAVAERRALLLAIRARRVGADSEARRLVIGQLCQSDNYIIRSQAMELRAELGDHT